MPWDFPIVTLLQGRFPTLPWPGMLVAPAAAAGGPEGEAAPPNGFAGFVPYRPAEGEVVHTANATGLSGQHYKLFYWPEHVVWSVHHFRTNEPATIETFATREDAKAWAQAH